MAGIIEDTRKVVDEQGFCIWRLKNINNRMICIVNSHQDEAADYAPCFTLNEIEQLHDATVKEIDYLILVKETLGGAELLERIVK